MKIILTTSEIIHKLGLSTDAELVIEQDQSIDADGWISNVGCDHYSHPDSLSSDTEIEVKYRTGNTDIGFARNWFTSWKETDGQEYNIVAYRIL